MPQYVAHPYAGRVSLGKNIFLLRLQNVPLGSSRSIACLTSSSPVQQQPGRPTGFRDSFELLVRATGELICVALQHNPIKLLGLPVCSFVLFVLEQQIGQEIGRGGFGTVFQALNTATGDFVAVKRMEMDSVKLDAGASIKVCMPSRLAGRAAGLALITCTQSSGSRPWIFSGGVYLPLPVGRGESRAVRRRRLTDAGKSVCTT